MSLYRQIFGQALKLTWKNKYFWLIGICTVFFSTSVEIELFDNFFNANNGQVYDARNLIQGGFLKPGVMDAVKNALAVDNDGLMVMSRVFAVFILILLALLLVSVLSQLVVIDHTANILKTSDDFKAKRKLGWLASWQRVKGSLFSASLLSVAMKVIVSLAFLIISLPLIIFSPEQSWAINLAYVVLFLIFLPLAIISAFVIRYMIAYIVINKQPVKRAIASGWQLFKANWLISMEMSFMLFLINIFGSLAVIIITSALAVPLWFLAVAGQLAISAKTFYVILGLAYLVLAILFILGGSLLSIFNITSWTSLFLRLNKEGGESKIVRLVGGLMDKTKLD